MAIAVLGHLAERIGRLWLAPGTDAADRDRLERRFDEFDERRLARDVIDRLLDGVTSLRASVREVNTRLTTTGEPLVPSER